MLSDEDQAMESRRRRRSPSWGVETSMAGRERKCPPSLPNLSRHGNPATAVEDYRYRSTKEAQQGRLHPSEGVETYFAAIDTRQATRSGYCREDLVRYRDLRTIAYQPLRRKETEVCRVGTTAPLGAHLHSVARQEGGKSGQFGHEGGIQQSL
jgi:hypothetical protein